MFGGKKSRENLKDREELEDDFFFLSYLFIYLWLCWVFVSVRGLSLVAASRGQCSSRCAGLSLSWPFLLRSTGSRHAGSVAVAHGPRCSAACGIFPDQGSNPCPLHWQEDSQPLRHQGSPRGWFLNSTFCVLSFWKCLRELSCMCNKICNYLGHSFCFIITLAANHEKKADSGCFHSIFLSIFHSKQ